jgi:biotin operon repressor
VVAVPTPDGFKHYFRAETRESVRIPAVLINGERCYPQAAPRENLAFKRVAWERLIARGEALTLDELKGIVKNQTGERYGDERLRSELRDFSWQMRAPVIKVRQGRRHLYRLARSREELNGYLSALSQRQTTELATAAAIEAALPAWFAAASDHERLAALTGDHWGVDGRRLVERLRQSGGAVPSRVLEADLGLSASELDTLISRMRHHGAVPLVGDNRGYSLPSDTTEGMKAVISLRGRARAERAGTEDLERVGAFWWPQNEREQHVVKEFLPKLPTQPPRDHSPAYLRRRHGEAHSEAMNASLEQAQLRRSEMERYPGLQAAVAEIRAGQTPVMDDATRGAAIEYLCLDDFLSTKRRPPKKVLDRSFPWLAPLAHHLARKQPGPAATTRMPVKRPPRSSEVEVPSFIR